MGGDASQEHDSGGHHAGPTLVFFIAFGMLVGAFCRFLSRRAKFPYTPLLLICGLGLGYFRHILPAVGQGAQLMSQMNAHMILFIFIPVLIFESGFNCDWYTFKKEIVNILLLAGPGVLWGAIVIAFCFKGILGYDELTWNEALTLGCVLSATDPVAVVALLKELGASVRFNTLIQGQSLLNDGTAMVFYMLFLDMVKGKASTAVQVLVNFVRIGLGGPLLGVGVGLVAAYFLKKVVRDDVMTANITFLSCYFCFWLAEYTFLKVSGILSIVVLGLFLSAVARTRIHPESEHSLHAIWSYIQYICQTTIFLLTGIIISVELIEKSTITSTDWVKMFIFFVLMNLARGVMCLTLLPLLRSFGYGVSMKEFIVLVYGGLRGALGLCLGLLVAVDYDLTQRFRELTIFYVSGMATLTLLINGTTCGKLVNYVEMIEKPAVKEKLYRKALSDIMVKTDEMIEDMKSDRFLSLVDWQKVRFYLGDIKMSEKVRQLEDQIMRKSRIEGQSIKPLQQTLKRHEVETELRYKSIKLIQSYVWQRYETGHCQETAANFISEICNVNLDNPAVPLVYWQHLAPSFTYDNMTLWIKAQSWPYVGSMARNYIVMQLYAICDIATNVIVAMEETKETMEQFAPEEQFHIIAKELDVEISKAQNYLIDMETQFPEMVGIIQMKKAVCTILKRRKEEYYNYVKNGFMDDGQLKETLLELDKQLYSLEQLELGVPAFKKEALEFPIFSTLSAVEVQSLLEQSTLERYDIGAKLYQVGQPINEIYLVKSGSVGDSIGSQTIVRGMGGVLSPANILSRTKQAYSTAQIKTQNTYLLVVPLELVYKLMVGKDFRFRIFTMSIYYFSRLYKQKADFLATMDQNKLNQYVRRSSMEIVRPSEVIELPFGGYIFEGQVHIQGLDASYTYGPYAYLHPGYTYMNMARRTITVLKFRSLRPGLEQSKHHEKRKSMLEADDGHHHRTKHDLIEKLLQHKPRAEFGEARKSGNEMIEMLALGDKKSAKKSERKSQFGSPSVPPPAPAPVAPPSKLSEYPKVDSVIEQQKPIVAQPHQQIVPYFPNTSPQPIQAAQPTQSQQMLEPVQQMTAQQYYYMYYMYAQQQANQQK